MLRDFRQNSRWHIAPQGPQPSPLPSRLPSSHTSEGRACPQVSRGSAQLDERPGHQGARLLGSVWDDGIRDGSHPPSPSTSGCPPTGPWPSRSRSAPAGGMNSDRWVGSEQVHAAAPSEQWARGVAGALERGGDRSGGAADAPPPGGASATTGLEDVEKV